MMQMQRQDSYGIKRYHLIIYKIKNVLDYTKGPHIVVLWIEHKSPSNSINHILPFLDQLQI
jgi:hypothetical protein